MFYRIIYRLGLQLRNPSLIGFYKNLLETDFADTATIKAIQERKFRELLDFAFNYSPYYQNRFKELNIQRHNVETIEDLSKLPILDKNELRENAHLINSTYKFKKTVISETSGTSGQPLKFIKNEEWDSMNRAAMFRGYSWYGLKPWDRNGYFWGYNISGGDKFKINLLDILQNRFRIFTYNESEIIHFSKKLKSAKYLEGYSSMIYEVAKRINTIPSILKPEGIKLIKGTSEKIYDNYHEETIKAFGSRIRSEYGAAEAGLIAFECPEGFMHINSENVIVEEIDGDIVVTNLMSKSFPIIRYKLGDKINLAEKEFKCKCGRHHPIILDVLGRVGKNIVGHNNSYPSLTFYYVFKNLALNNNIILNYQAIQEKKGIITLRIEQENKESQPLLMQELKKYFGSDIDFTIQFGVTLHTMDGKLKDFITTL